MKLQYVGPSFGVDSLTDGKVYECLGLEGGLLKIIDDSEEDYLYSLIPGPMDDQSIKGRWVLVEDDDEGTLKKVFTALEEYAAEKRKKTNL